MYIFNNPFINYHLKKEESTPICVDSYRLYLFIIIFYLVYIHPLISLNNKALLKFCCESL